MSGVVHKVLKEGANDVGKTHADFKPSIEVRSAGIDKKHCIINYSEAYDETMVYPNQTDPEMYTVKINGELVTQPTRLSPGDRILFGPHIYYLYIHPKINKDAVYEYEDAVKEANRDQM